MSNDIWVVGELRGSEPSPWTLELVSGASALAAENGGHVTVLIPEGSDAGALERHGAETVVSIAGAAEQPPVEVTVAAARELLATERPRLTLFPDSLCGRDAASQVAAALELSFVSACERITLSENSAIRSCFRGQLSATLDLPAGAAIATVCEHTFQARETREAGHAERRSVEPQSDGRVVVTDTVAPDPEALGLQEADVLASGGLGVGGPAGFELLERLARLVGGTTSASRAAVDQGWVPRSKQVGQTGVSVTPRVYFACGISGALQHMVGIRGAGKVVALNTDQAAPIMQEADLAAVGDAAEVLPLLLNELDNGGTS
ncbi:MAG: electron transfer flavoprotein subunit alpha/FixB family protein [Dehalococcoidia bacterium]|jgi:electron transfer flavoprotein alpha subunit|nr:electron transfer flavoprotein subunit alpha/FixB family protein [Dehalococcoidia bacterium]